MKKTAIKKADIVLLTAVTVAAAVFFVLSFIHVGGDYAVIYVDGEEHSRLSLSEDTELTVATEWGENTVTVAGGEAYVSDADCPDGTCVRSRAVSREGQSIICLPHRLMLVIESASADGNDVDLELK